MGNHPEKVLNSLNGLRWDQPNYILLLKIGKIRFQLLQKVKKKKNKNLNSTNNKVILVAVYNFHNEKLYDRNDTPIM